LWERSRPGLDDRSAEQRAEEMSQFDAVEWAPMHIGHYVAAAVLTILALWGRDLAVCAPQALIRVTLGSTTHFKHCDH
jgi:ABC-type transport system involved in cytochrome c biogenesis permease subunit